MNMRAVVSPLHSTVEAVKVDIDGNRRRELFGQMPIPWIKKEHRFDPMNFIKSGRKIVNYDAKELRIWGALISFSHTVLSDRNTWRHLTLLTVICFCTMGIVVGSGTYKSIKDQNTVSGKIQTLISFVFAGYIGIVINRWDRVRNTTLSQIWGAIENLNMIAYRVLGPANEDSDKLKDLILRLCRLCFQLTFLAVQGDGELGHLVDRGLLTEKEKLWLDDATIGSRPMVVVDWIYSYFDMIREKGYKFGDPVESQVHVNVQNLRGGIGTTLGAIGAQLPYPYVHCIYWTVQMLLLALAVESGVLLATNLYTKSNGNGEWSPPDGSAWPENQDIWYLNSVLETLASNILFALFCEGMLKICDKLSNPMSKDDTSFSEFVYDAFIYNNCRALRVGLTSFQEVLAEDIAALKQN